LNTLERITIFNSKIFSIIYTKLETRAWTIHNGTKAAAAAGKIHSDLEKRVMRAEVITYFDMVQYEGQAREVGKARSEGRKYIVKDGDVILFYHSN